MSDEPDGALTSGCLQSFFDGKSLGADDECYVQVLETKKIASGRVKLIVHDSTNAIDALLNAKFNGVLEDTGETGVTTGSVLQVTNACMNSIGGKDVLLLQDMVVIQRECEDLSGGAAPPMLERASAPKAKPAFGGNRGFGGNNAFGNRNKPANNAFGGRNNGGNTGFNRNRGGGGAVGKFYPVKSLNPFMKDCCIKVRVTSKGDIRHWSNSRGEGKLFNVNLIDSEGTEIQATAFNDTVDQLYPIFEDSKVFVIRKARVKPANKRYTHIKHDYCLDLADAEVEPCAEDDGSIKVFSFDFKTIKSLEEAEDKSFADVMGMCTAISEVQEFTSKAGKELTKRTFTLTDQSSAAIEATLWGDAARNFDEGNKGKVIGLQAARVSEYNGRSLTCNAYYIEPDVPETQTMQQWWAANQASLQVKSLSTSRGGGGKNMPPITASEGKMKGLTEGTPEYFNCRLMVTYIPIKQDRNPWYTSCPSEAKTDGRKCMKKVLDNGGTWRCDSCDQDFSNYIPRWVLKVKGQDHTSSMFLSAFDDYANIIVGMTAAEAEAIKNEDPARFEKMFDDVLLKEFNMRIRAKMDNYMDDNRQRFDIVGIAEIDDTKHLQELAAHAQKLLASA